MIPHCGFFARHRSAATSALQWGLLRNLGGTGAPSDNILLLVGIRPWDVFVCIRGYANESSQSQGPPHVA